MKSYLILLGSLLIAFGGWAATGDSWHQLTDIKMLPPFISTVGGIIMAWLGASPLKSK